MSTTSRLSQHIPASAIFHPPQLHMIIWATYGYGYSRRRGSSILIPNNTTMSPSSPEKRQNCIATLNFNTSTAFLSSHPFVILQSSTTVSVRHLQSSSSHTHEQKLPTHIKRCALSTLPIGAVWIVLQQEVHFMPSSQDDYRGHLLQMGRTNKWRCIIY